MEHLELKHFLLAAAIEMQTILSHLLDKSPCNDDCVFGGHGDAASDEWQSLLAQAREMVTVFTKPDDHDTIKAIMCTRLALALIMTSMDYRGEHVKQEKEDLLRNDGTYEACEAAFKGVN